jgi:hypothetical protein
MVSYFGIYFEWLELTHEKCEKAPEPLAKMVRTLIEAG